MLLYKIRKGEATIYWATLLFTDKMAKFNKHNIVIWNYTEQTAQFIDIKSPQDYNVVNATANKITE